MTNDSGEAPTLAQRRQMHKAASKHVVSTGQNVGGQVWHPLRLMLCSAYDLGTSSPRDEVVQTKVDRTNPKGDVPYVSKVEDHIIL